MLAQRTRCIALAHPLAVVELRPVGLCGEQRGDGRKRTQRGVVFSHLKKTREALRYCC